MQVSFSPGIELNADAVPVEPSSHRSIVDSERSVKGSSMNGGKGIGGEVCGQSCSSSAVEGGRCTASLGIDLRKRFRGGGSGGDGIRAVGGG